jgi:hypothetical protein
MFMRSGGLMEIEKKQFSAKKKNTSFNIMKMDLYKVMLFLDRRQSLSYYPFYVNYIF